MVTVTEDIGHEDAILMNNFKHMFFYVCALYFSLYLSLGSDYAC